MTNNQIFDALANEHRRELLVALLKENPQHISVDHPTEDVDTRVSNPNRRLQTAMCHSHLPKLEDYGFIRWNEDTHEITKGPRFDEIRPLLRWLDGHAGTTADLTDNQRNLLLSAVREGYFEVPRKVSVVELAEEHGVSSREALEELTRGLDVVVHDAVFVE